MEQPPATRRAANRLARRRRLRRHRAFAACLLAIVLAGGVLVHRHGGPLHVYRRVHEVALLAMGKPDTPTALRGAKVVEWDFHSSVLDRTLPEVVVLPRGFRADQRRPLLVFLHGRKRKPGSPRNRAIEGAVGQVGEDAPVVLLANGGDHSYFHDRRDGKWGTYVSEELVGYTVRKYGLDDTRVAYAGLSMGGYGALELTREANRTMCGVGAIAPALFLSAEQSASGAFDDADDFNAHDPLAAVRADNAALHGTPVFLAGGDEDPFREGTDAMADALRGGPSPVVRRTGAGGHSRLYWNPLFKPMLEWFVDRFDTC